MMDWAHLTRIPLKVQLYSRETWFRDGAADAADVLGERASALLHRTAMLTIKPDGLVAGKAPIVIDFLHKRGFEVAAVETISFDRFMWRELWRYQLTCATLDRLAVNELVLRGTAVVLLLRYAGTLSVPASVFLGRLKGNSDVATQARDCLRRQIGQPNRVLSYIHVADEPADVLRELAILIEPSARRRLLGTLLGRELTATERDTLAGITGTARSNARDADAASAIDRAERALAAVDRTGSSRMAAAQIADDLAAMRRGETVAWLAFHRAVRAAGIELDPWDLAVLGTSFIVYDEPGTTKQIVGVDPELWERGSAQPS